MPIKDPELRAIRAKEMIAMRTSQGMTNAQIAEEMNIHPDTVKRTLTWAKKAQLFVAVEDQILQDVVPKAIEALKAALDDGDGELAVKVLNNTIWATQQAAKGSNGASAPHKAQQEVGEDLAAYIAQIRAKAQQEEETTDAHIIRGDRGEEFAPDQGGIRQLPGSIEPTAASSVDEETSSAGA